MENTMNRFLAATFVMFAVSCAIFPLFGTSSAAYETTYLHQNVGIWSAKPSADVRCYAAQIVELQSSYTQIKSRTGLWRVSVDSYNEIASGMPPSLLIANHLPSKI